MRPAPRRFGALPIFRTNFIFISISSIFVYTIRLSRRGTPIGGCGIWLLVNIDSSYIGSGNIRPQITTNPAPLGLKPMVLSMKKPRAFAVITITALVLLSIARGAQTSQTNRPPHWAKPMQMKGVPNLHKVSNTLFRNAQPSPEGIRNIKAMGIETVINLRSFHSDRDEIGDTGLAYERIYMKAWHPEEKEAVRFLQIVTNPKRVPILVHCQHGADRTGTQCALYRMAVQGWSKEEAIEEMMRGGFGFHGL